MCETPSFCTHFFARKEEEREVHVGLTSNPSNQLTDLFIYLSMFHAGVLFFLCVVNIYGRTVNDMVMGRGRSSGHDARWIIRGGVRARVLLLIAGLGIVVATAAPKTVLRGARRSFGLMRRLWKALQPKRQRQYHDEKDDHQHLEQEEEHQEEEERRHMRPMYGAEYDDDDDGESIAQNHVGLEVGTMRHVVEDDDSVGVDVKTHDYGVRGPEWINDDPTDSELAIDRPGDLENDNDGGDDDEEGMARPPAAAWEEQHESESVVGKEERDNGGLDDDDDGDEVSSEQVSVSASSSPSVSDGEEEDDTMHHLLRVPSVADSETQDFEKGNDSGLYHK